MQRYTLHFSGRVQGVGFRYTTVQIAAAYAVTGFVQNLPDGRVGVVCEGEPAELDRFVQAIGARMSGYVDDVIADHTEATGEFTRFDVRY